MGFVMLMEERWTDVWRGAIYRGIVYLVTKRVRLPLTSEKSLVCASVSLAVQ